MAARMTPDEYRAARQRRGTQVEVAQRLGIDRSTVARREGGGMVITTEAALAILRLRPLKARRSSGRRIASCVQASRA
jgi:transcriptional regulator with XRE-family HTH domain